MNLCEEVSLITTPQRTKLCWLCSFWPEELLTAFICHSPCEPARAVSRRVPLSRGGREGLCRAHGSHWVAPRRVGALGTQLHPRLLQHKEAACKALSSAFPTFIFSLRGWFFSLFPEHHAGSGSAVSRSSTSPHGAA